MPIEAAALQRRRLLTTLAVVGAAMTGAGPRPGKAQPPRAHSAIRAAPPHPNGATPALTQIASFEQQLTGVAVTKDGRIFVNFPRWEKDVPISVAEVMGNGSLKPYPDAAWNSWSNLKHHTPQEPPPGERFVCVQSVTVDPQGALWVLDPAAPGNEFIIPGGPKLVKIDPKTDKVVQVIRFDTAAAPQGSYLNDVRVSPDGRTAYLTDSGQRGALLVIDVASGQARRVLDGDKRTQSEPGVVPHVDGHELRQPDNRIPAFAADGIALDPKGEFLYWQALVGRTLYRVPTAALIDAGLSAEALGGRVETVGTTNVADGLWMDEQGYLFITDPENNAVRMRAPDGTITTIARDKRLRWPDSMAEGADGSIYVTASHIQDMARFHDKGSTRTMPYGLFRIAPPHLR
jgi:sugar lactone lactonase YvrE